VLDLEVGPNGGGDEGMSATGADQDIVMWVEL
jgi:hypothetical protein